MMPDDKAGSASENREREDTLSEEILKTKDNQAGPESALVKKVVASHSGPTVRVNQVEGAVKDLLTSFSQTRW